MRSAEWELRLRSFSLQSDSRLIEEILASAERSIGKAENNAAQRLKIDARMVAGDFRLGNMVETTRAF